MLHRHERTFEAKVRYAFPGGAYKTPTTSAPTRQKDRGGNVQEDSDDEGEDLMDTDDEIEDSDSETEEDRVFINDEVEGEQGLSFYRALVREREMQINNDQEDVDDGIEVKSPDPMKKRNIL